MTLQLPDRGEVHIWTASLRAPSARLAEYRRSLAPDEIARADRIVVAGKREQSIVSRGVLRRLLGRYLAAAPADLVFRYGAHGRPELGGASRIAFNVSHSGDLAVFAFSSGVEIGVDVERVRENVDFLGIGRRFFSPLEHDALQSAPDAARSLAFFRCWTRKESYLKARGAGLALPLDGFDVTLLDDRPELLATRFDPEDAPRWALAELVPAPGYVAALCASPRPSAIVLLGDAG